MRDELAFLVIPVAVVALFFGVLMGGHPDSLPGFLRHSFLVDSKGRDSDSVRAELLEKINDSYYKKVDDDTLEQDSLKAIVKGLDDRFSHYFSPSETKQFNQSISGSFSGVGMTVGQDKRGLRVQMVFADTPARRGGLRKGDVISAVNGKSIAGDSADVATGKIKGPAGTAVTITVQSPPSKRKRALRLRREEINVPVARSRIVRSGGKRIGVLQLAQFTQEAHAFVAKQIDSLKKKGAQGIVFDLRGNPGGLLEEGVLVSSLFVDKGKLVVSTKGRTKPERKFEAVGGSIARSLPVVLLVDRGTASAAEITTGALHLDRNATIVGTRTYGKGVFQEVQSLSNGGTLDMTVGQYFLPNGTNISGKGIKPQVRARDNPRTRRDEALPVALRTIKKQIR